MTPLEFSEAIKQPGVYLVDVRPADYFKNGHIKGAANLDVTKSDFKEEAQKILPKDKTIAVYCQTGMHSAIAKKELEELGYKVINLDNGINSWVEAQLPVTLN